ncbi:hypothetical protein OAP01_13150, partial [Akkermansiaceae bacterium]|nr:hypothetical protein [Akkermansiaceae bacterium]
NNIIGGWDFERGFWRVDSRVRIIHESEIDNQSAWIKIDPKEELKFFTFLIWLRNLLDITISSTGKSGIGIASFLYKFVPVLLLITLALGGGFLYHFIITPSDSPASRPQRNVIKVEETTQRRGGPFGLNRRRVYKVTYEDANGVIRTDERYSDPTK